MQMLMRAFLGGLLCAAFAGPLAAQDYFAAYGAEATNVSQQADNAAGFQNESLSQVYARLNAIESEISSMQTNPNWQALQQGRLRSTDIPRPMDTAQTAPFPKVKLTGFFQADAGFFDQSAANRAQFGDIQDTAGFRRTRLAAVGDVNDNLSYMLEMDFSFPGRPSFMDVWLDIHEIAFLGNVRIGQWRQPFGMSAMTSVRELMFLERPLMQAFVPFRQIGIGFHDTNAAKTITWAGSGFRFPTDQFGGIGTISDPVAPPAGTPPIAGAVGDQGYGLAGRVTAIAWGDCDECGPLLHIGADYAYLRPGTGNVRYRTPAEFGGPFVGGLAGNLSSVPFFVDTGAVPTQNINLYDFEMGARLGSLYGMAEATYAVIQTPLGTETLPGAYVQGAYLLTGEERPYNSTAGVFGRIKPYNNFGWDTGWGAWEACARYSYIDMNNAFSATTLIVPGLPAGGLMSNITLGLNWYLNQYAKLQFNYIDARVNRGPVGFTETGIVAARAQLDF